MLLENNIEISESDVHNVSNSLVTVLNDSISRYIALGYKVIFKELLDSNSDTLFDAYSSYTSVYNYMDESLLKKHELSKLIKVYETKQSIFLNNIVEIPVDIGLHFNMYMYYSLTYNQSDGKIDARLLGMKFYADEINKDKVDDGEIYISLDLGDFDNRFGIFVISNNFKMLDNIIFLDIKCCFNIFRLCLCSTHTELIN